MNVINEFSKWDDLDFLFNRAKWKIKDEDIIKKIKEENFYELLSVFEEFNLKFYFDGITKENLTRNRLLSHFTSEDYIYIADKKIEKNLIDELKRKNFIVINLDYKKLLIKNFHIIYLNSTNYDHRLTKQKEIMVKGNKFNVYYKKSKIIKKINIKDTLNKTKYNLKFLYLKIKSIFYPYISETEFLGLNIEQLNSKSWQLRKGHLDLVTNNKHNIVVAEIVGYFKNTNNLEKAKKEIIQTDTSNVFEEPLYANKNFWLTGNNFFINNIIYQFRENVVSYKEANTYVQNKNNKYLLYSNEYYESLKIIDDKELKNFLKKNPIEISKNSIVSGKHRAFAMIGRLINNQEYIKFKVRYVR